VKRGVTELVTPGLTFNDAVLDGRSNNFLAAYLNTGDYAGLAFLDITTGEFLIAEGNLEHAEKLIQGFRPSEVLVRKTFRKQFEEQFGDKMSTFGLEDWACNQEFGKERLLRHFDLPSLKGFGIEEMNPGIAAAGAILYYLEETKHDATSHIRHIARIEEEKFVWLDKFTIRNLELIRSNHEGGTSLLDVLDNTLSPMGSRMLKRWVLMPLKEISLIEERLSIVEKLMNSPEMSEELTQILKSVGDLERMVSKASAARINPRELRQLYETLCLISPLRDMCKNSGHAELMLLADQLNPCEVLREKINQSLTAEPPAMIQRGGVIASGVHAELDELRTISSNGKDFLLQIQEKESEKTGIPSLKVAYNNVFGYFIEVRNTHKDKVPPEWIRKQTLTQAERYITEELKIYEGKILGAEEKIAEIEIKLFNELVTGVAEYLAPIQNNARVLARLDCLLSFAKNAVRFNYTRPRVNEGFELTIKEGRHPVIEQHLPPGEAYVSNDIYLDNEHQQIIMITGPNMSGKSALLRQTALIVIMAQTGSYVPAKSADIGLIDKVFTRVGASDNISGGESTFMVEMNETASILNNLSERSLVLLDEIGRGTSTYDGISIAWAIAEYLHEHPKNKAKTLFATHYHELNDMTDRFSRVKNFNVSVREVGGKIIFLRKLAPGGSNHSFGIHVAKLAGMPKEVVRRAEEVLIGLERSHSGSEINKKPKEDKDFQLSFFQLDDPVLEKIKDDILATDINSLTPIEALNKLNEIKKTVTGR
jgi:DNA mismatch repair protein MutS